MEEGSGEWYADEDLDIAPSDGIFIITVSRWDIPGGGTDEDEKRIRSTDAFQEVIKYQVEHQQEIFQNIMKAAQKCFDEAVSNKEEWFDPETVDLYLPEVHGKDDLKALLDPSFIRIGFSEKKSLCNVGYKFECSWEEEHAFGVRMQQPEVIEFGHASVNF